MKNKNTLPTPEELFAQASGTIEDSILFPYTDTIVLLREKKHSYRGISKWLAERGINASHTTVKNFLDTLHSDEDLRDVLVDAHMKAQDVIATRGVGLKAYDPDEESNHVEEMIEGHDPDK